MGLNTGTGAAGQSGAAAAAVGAGVGTGGTARVKSLLRNLQNGTIKWMVSDCMCDMCGALFFMRV